MGRGGRLAFLLVRGFFNTESRFQTFSSNPYNCENVAIYLKCFAVELYVYKYLQLYFGNDLQEKETRDTAIALSNISKEMNASKGWRHQKLIKVVPSAG